MNSWSTNPLGPAQHLKNICRPSCGNGTYLGPHGLLNFLDGHGVGESQAASVWGQSSQEQRAAPSKCSGHRGCPSHVTCVLVSRPDAGDWKPRAGRQTDRQRPNTASNGPVSPLPALDSWASEAVCSEGVPLVLGEISPQESRGLILLAKVCTGLRE